MPMTKLDDPMIALLKIIARQDEEIAMNAAYEAAADDLLMAEMELARARKKQAAGLTFIPRDQLFQTPPMAHPADLVEATN